jgi:hypothetical protein
LLSDGLSDAISTYNSDTHSETMSKTIPESTSDHSQRSTLLEEGGLPQWLCAAVSHHLCSQYVAQVDLTVTSNIGRKIVLGRKVGNCYSAEDFVLDVHDQ